MEGKLLTMFGKMFNRLEDIEKILKKDKKGIDPAFRNAVNVMIYSPESNLQKQLSNILKLFENFQHTISIELKKVTHS
ncbi:MAG: hypothetical protein CSA15_04140 [Candidatus Delongbacteria bacterium]|nr:MAG: hypothetical protein CSA15_04140 [Candidatus Delongbacteria bacterium]